MKESSREKALKLFQKYGVLRPRDFDEQGIPRITLQRLHEQGLLERIDRGLYRLSNAPISEHYSLVEISKRVPTGVVCLLSSLRFHGLTTQAPFEVWVAIDRKARLPRISGLPVRFVRFSGKALAEGVETHIIDGVPVKIYNPAKTVADCFKYRNKIGLDAALESLKECRQSRRCESEALWYYAKICRVDKVMRPYLEAVSA